jgi:exodeoxyribonuclease VII large subunit
VDRRLGRALLANARAHAMRLARWASKLQPRLLEDRLARMRNRVETLGRKAAASLTRIAGPRRARLERVAGRLSPQGVIERVARCVERLGVLEARARRAIANRLAAHRRHLDGCSKLLLSLGYHGVLQRGFALVRDEDGRAVRSVDQVASGQCLDIELGDGHFDAQALKGGRARQAAAPARTPAKPATSRGKPGGGSQGSLF